MQARVVVGRPKEEKKSRYIGSIMEAHKGREIENEKLYERKMQREAEVSACEPTCPTCARVWKERVAPPPRHA